VTDFVDLGIRVDTTQVEKGVGELDKLAAAGARAEGATGRVTRSATEQAAQMRTNADLLNQVTRATNPVVSSQHLLDATLQRVKRAYIDGKVSAELYAKAQTLAARGSTEFATSGRQVAVSAGQQRAGMQQLSFQIGDVAQQFALGTRPMQIFAQQGGQVIQAIGMMSNSSKGLIGFLAGPWGAILTGAAVILGSVFAAHGQAADGAKTQEDAARDLADAIKDLNDAAVKETQSAYAQARANIVAAESHRTRAVEARKAAVAELELARATFSAAQAELSKALPGKGGVEVAVGQLTSASRTKELNAEIAKQNKLIEQGNQTIRIRQGQLVNMKLEEALDKGLAATGKFNRAQDELNKQLATGRITLDQYAAASLNAMRTREKEEEAARKSDKTRKERKKGLTDEQRAYQQAVKEAERYIEALDLEIEKTGKTAAQIRQIEIARAKEAAPTAALKAKIDELNVSREKALAITEAETKAKDRKKNDAQLLEPIKTELALLGLTGDARDKAALKMEFEAKQARMLADELNISAAALQAWYDTSLQIIEGESALEREARAARSLLDAMAAVAEQAAVTGEIMSSAFGSVGDVFGGLIANLADYQLAKEQLAQQVVAGNLKQEVADKRLATLNARNTAQAISGVKSLFKEKSTGYKIMQAIEMAYAAWQAINTVRSIAMDSAKTASSVANSGARAAADGVAAIAKAIASLPFPLNLAAGAATAAALVAFGVKVFGGGGGGGTVTAPTSAEQLQEQAGTGSILGDSKAKSDSIARSLELVAANTNRDLEYSNAMLKALRNIDTSISRMAGTVARQIQVDGSVFDTSGAGLGTNSKKGFLGLFGGSTTTKSLFDLGINLDSASVADIIADGISGSTYQIIEKIKKKNGFLGIGGSTKTSYITTTGALDGDITSAIQQVVMSLRDGLLTAADVIGLQGAEAILDSFQVSIGKISFKDMTGEQIEDQLNAIFSKIGDDMAGAIFPALTELQLIGEGLFETFIRVAKEYEAVDIALQSIGRTFGMVGIQSVAARSSLVQLFGGLEEFLEATDFFRDQFLSEAERIAPVQAAVTAELARLGVSGVTTRDQFKALVLGLDLTTAAGREMYASLLAVAPAFDKVLDYLDQANKAQISALQSTIEQFTKFAESLTKYRDTLFQTDAAQGSAYAVLKARFLSTADLAATGNADALGGLENAGRSFLDAARNNASSREQYLRDVAVVARGVDAGIIAAEETADYAQLQLDALRNATAILAQINANTAATAGALGAPTAGGPAPASTGPTPSEQQIISQNETIIRQNAALIEIAQQQQRLWTRFDGDGLLIRTDADTPIQTEVV
jgi:hypothetical protein